MKLYDVVELNTESEDLSNRGIHKGCWGFIARYDEDKSLIMFFNRQNSGDYAFAWVNNKNLTYKREHYKDFLEDTKKFLATHDPAEKTAFNVLKLKEYDFVELIVEKKIYAKEGVHKGMKGCITQPYAIKDKWNVIFSADDGTDIAELGVYEEDLKKI